MVVLTLKNLLSKGNFGAQMVDLGLPQIVQNLKAQAWSDEVRKQFFHVSLLPISLSNDRITKESDRIPKKSYNIVANPTVHDYHLAPCVLEMMG